MSRFDYVKYDEKSASLQALFKIAFDNLASAIEGLSKGRAQSLAITKLEEAYMWVGKALRDEQISRSVQVELQEERTNS